LRPVAMRDSPEFRRIRALIEACGAPPTENVRLGPGDDAALIGWEGNEDLVVSTDLCVEDVHFHPMESRSVRIVAGWSF